MIEHHPFFHELKNRFYYDAIIENYPPNSYIITRSKRAVWLANSKGFDEAIKLRFSTGTNEGAVYYERDAYIGVFRDLETVSCRYTLVKESETDTSECTSLSGDLEPESLEPENSDNFGKLGRNNIREKALKKAELFENIEGIIKKYFPDFKGVPSSRALKLNGVIEKDPAFHSDNSQENKVREGEIGSYFWRTSSLDEGPQCSERFYVLCGKINQKNPTFTKLLFKVERLAHVLKSKNTEEFIINRFARCYQLESGEVKEYGRSFYSISQVVHTYVLHAKPIVPANSLSTSHS